MRDYVLDENLQDDTHRGSNKSLAPGKIIVWEKLNAGQLATPSPLRSLSLVPWQGRSLFYSCRMLPLGTGQTIIADAHMGEPHRGQHTGVSRVLRSSSSLFQGQSCQAESTMPESSGEYHLSSQITSKSNNATGLRTLPTLPIKLLGAHSCLRNPIMGGFLASLAPNEFGSEHRYAKDSSLVIATICCLGPHWTEMLCNTSTDTELPQVRSTRTLED